MKSVSHLLTRTLRNTFILFSLISSAWTFSLCQDSLKSPVFRGYRPPKPAALIEQSDLTYQLWQTFSLTQRANSGDATAQHELGVRYLVGRGVQADTARGSYWTKKAAEQNLLPAKFNYGIVLFNGWGIGWSPFLAYDQFLYCANIGMPEAQYILGQFLTDNLVVKRNWFEAYRWVKAAADSGYGPAKELLLEFAKRGRVPADSSRVEAPLSMQVGDTVSGRAASAGLNWSPVFLDFSNDTTAAISDEMLMHDAKREGPEKIREAIEKDSTISGLVASNTLSDLRNSANVGSPEALTLLGRFHEKGYGVKADMVKAAAFYIRSVRAGSARAPSLLWNLTEHGLNMAELQARSANQDDEAVFVLAGLAGLGFNALFIKTQTMLTENQALELLQRAAARNHLPSLIELGLCYYSGRWVKQSEAKALDLWRRAAEEGSEEALVRSTAVMLARGTGDFPSLLGILANAEHSGSVLAQVALGICFERGIGVTMDKGKAAQLYRRATERGSHDGLSALVNLHDSIRPMEKRFAVGD